MGVIKFEFEQIDVKVDIGLTPQPFGCVPYTVTFDAITDNGNAFFWDFGNGVTSQAKDTTITYTAVGTYNIRVIAENSTNCTGLVLRDTAYATITVGDEPLDASSVHPEAYPVVERILAGSGRQVKQIVGDIVFLRAVKAEQYTDEKFGVPTIRDILKELEKPGRDPRPEFKTAEFQEGVETLKDLELGMMLEGVVTNVTNFGAFVDIGVHQDGLVHISALSEKFIKDPHEAVKAGDVVKVKVMEVDIPRNRIALSMRMGDTPGEKIEGPRGGARGSKPAGNAPRSERHSSQDKPAPASGGMAALFANAKQLKK